MFKSNFLMELLKKIDIYGSQMNFSVQDEVKKITTVFGGFMTLLFFCMVLFYMG
jgi:hypothetical protein